MLFMTGWKAGHNTSHMYTEKNDAQGLVMVTQTEKEQIETLKTKCTPSQEKVSFKCPPGKYKI